LRLIYVVCEVAYRLVADKRKVSKLGDLKGKKIGTFSGSSAGVFIHNMLSSAGIADNGYTTVAGNVCMKSPCASNTLPTQLKAGVIDAFGIWEPAVELGIESLGPSNVVVFQNSSVYREVYALYSTTDALNDPGKRKDIVEFVRALNKTLDVFANMPKEKGIYDYVAGKVGMDESVVEKVWGVHTWSGRWGSDLIDYIAAEDKYLAGQDKRAVITRKDLETFLDSSVLNEL
jgi:ABC-type nitrate/sulfonate/bicarbonate transport system substrate-binding protein